MGLALCPIDEATQTFQELATKVHDMEMAIANCRGKASPTFEAREDKDDFKKNSKSSNSTSKESMSVTTSDPIRISRKSKVEEKQRPSMKDAGKKRPTLKELQEKRYPFPDSDLSGMLDDLLKKGIIELPPSKCPEEAGNVNDPKYCQYHRVIIHPLEKCITLKERILQLAQDGMIIIDLDEAAETNHMTILCKHCDLAPSMREELVTIQFRSFELVMRSLMVPVTLAEA